MRAFAVIVTLALASTGCQYLIGISDRDLEPSIGDDGGIALTCDPVAQDCDDGDKCASVIEPGSNPPTSVTDCVANGNRIEFETCTFTDGVDDCVAGFTCVKGFCERICPVAPAACSNPDLTCAATADLFSDQGGAIGACVLACDPIAQDCEFQPQEGCFLNEALGEGQCRPVPPQGPLHEEDCIGDQFGCFLNGCEFAHGPHLGSGLGAPPSQCAFYCSPVDTFINNTDFQFGDGETGIDCFFFDKGASGRPDGPGDRQCRFLQTFAGNSLIPESVGICVDQLAFGDCADCDVATQASAMSCSPGCISKRFFDSLPP